MALTLTTRRRVAKTDLNLPVLGFGAAHLGELYGKVSEEDSRATLQGAWDAGVRYYDTAPWYGRGLSEHRLGGFLRTQPRAKFQITTKVGRYLVRPKDPKTYDGAPWAGGLKFEVVFDYSRDGFMRAYAELLQRLGLDTVDVLIIHDLDSAYHTPELFAQHQRNLRRTGIKALEELKRSGDIKAIGMGINTTEAMETIAPLVDLDFCLVAMPYTLINQSSLHTGMARCIEKGISVIVGAPFASGILVTGSGSKAKYGYSKASPEVQAKVRGIEKIAKAHGVTLPAAALQFVLAHPAVVSAIPGGKSPNEVRENVASLQAPIPASFWSDLKTANLIDPDSPVPGGK